MRRIMIALGTLWVMLAMLAPAALAQNYLDEATNALKQASVYVAKGTENTDSTTIGYLTNQLNDGDTLVLVMLPANAKTAEGGVEGFAQKLDDATEHQHIVAVSIGTDAATSTTLLPPGIAPDMLQRAAGVATNTKETLGIFARNIHSWQKAHPEQVKKPEVPLSGSKAADEGFPWYLWAGLAAAVISLGSLLLLRRQHSASTSGPVKVKLGSPSRIKDELQEILDYRAKLSDQDLSNTLTQLVRDTERVFDQLRRNAPSQVDDQAEEFEQHLQSLCKILESYVDIQNNPRYYENSQQALDDGREAVNGFALYVLTSAQRAGKRTLTSFNVDTKILSAQRYR